MTTALPTVVKKVNVLEQAVAAGAPEGRAANDSLDGGVAGVPAVLLLA